MLKRHLFPVFAALGILCALPVSLRGQAAPSPPPLGKLFDIGQRRMHLHCQGSGSPTVVMESGASSFALDWALVQPDVARTTRVCSYDRAGYGWSDASKSGEAAEQVVRDLRALLGTAGERPPYVLVGASLGGIYIRMFVLRHPSEVAGLVFVDPSHEDRLWIEVQGKTIAVWDRSVDDVRRSLAPATAWEAMLAKMPARNPQTGAPFDRLPAGLYQTRIEFDKRLIASHGAATYDQYVDAEVGRQAAFVALHEQTVTGRSLGDRPVVVLTRGAGSSQELADVHAALAKQSTNSRHTVVANAGHEIHLFAPAAVIQAVQDVVEAVRRGSQLPPR